MGKNITWKKRKGKQNNLPYIIEVVGKNIKWGRKRNFFGTKSRYKKWDWGIIIKL